jgi:hypothetical protein
MIAIDEGTVARTTKTRSILLDLSKDAHMLMEELTSRLAENEDNRSARCSDN